MLKFNLILVLFLAVYLLPFGFVLFMERLNREHLRRSEGTVPGPFRGIIDSEKLARITAYTLDNSRLGLVQKAVKDTILLAMILTGALTVLDGFAPAFGYEISGYLFFILLGSVFFVVGLPFDWYQTFVLEERYGFNKSDLGTWILDHVKSIALSFVVLAVVLIPVLWTIRTFPTQWWLWGFLIVSAVQFILVMLYPVVIAPLFNKFEPLKDRELAEKVERLMRAAHMKTDGIFQMDAGRRSKHTNAYFTGLGKSKRIVLFDTLIDSHTHDEILSVLAHEVGHYKLRHVVKSLVLSLSATLLGFYITYLLMGFPLLYSTFGLDPSSSYIGLFVIGVFWQKAAFFVRPIGMAVSRRFERQADRFAKNLMKTATPMVDALKRLGRDNLANLNPHPFYVWFYYSHPPLLERINLLEETAESG
jgi:STE24 endopeptidase